MKSPHLAALAALLFVTACSNEKLSEYRGGAVVTGKGGAVRVSKKGFEIWSEGEPNRPYRIIAVVENSDTDGTVPFTDGEMSRRVKQVGGDAVILRPPERRYDGQGYFGGVEYEASASYAIVKYTTGTAATKPSPRR